MAETSQPEEGFTQANTETSAEARPIYEVGFHIAPTVTEDGVPAVVDKIRAAIGDSAEFISESFPQKMALAYTIERSFAGKREKSSEAYFGWIKFALEREAVQELQEKLRSIRDILRFILVETVREDVSQQPRRATFASDRLEGETLKKPANAPEKTVAVSDEEINKSLESLTG